MNENELYINHGIYYRLYGNVCYVWDTKTRRQFIFNSTVYDIFELIKRKGVISSENLIQQLSKKYSDNVCIISEAVIPFLGKLKEEKIIRSETDSDSIDIDQEVSQNFSDKKHLFSVLFELTYKCNEKCQHCYVEHPNEETKKELSTDEVKCIIDNLYRANVGEITFSGGELFVRSDAIEIIEHAAQKGFLINIFSNGTLLDSEKIIRIAKCNIRSYQTSIYGATAQIHDKITGVNGSFDKTIQVLDTFSKLGIATCIKTTMMNTNIQDYNDLIKLSKILKSDIQVGLSIMPTMLRNSTNSKYRLDENNLLKINIAEMKRFGETNIEKLPIESNGICNAGFSNLTINPYGDIILCSGMHVVFGNALKDDISRIWKSSPKLEEWQCKTLSDIECMKDCQYAEYCSFCPAQAYLETGNCFKKYEEACLIAKTQFKTEEVLKYELQNAK